MIGLINYGSGNIHAIANIYNRLNIPFSFVENEEQIHKADKLILPGVGDFDQTIKLLSSMGIRASLDDAVLIKKVPILGVCVGMQILGNKSEEGSENGLAWINGEIKLLDESKITSKPYLPHMGWNSISVKRNHPIVNNVDVNEGFYFLHNYYFDCFNDEDILCTTNYGLTFASAVSKDNIFGTQFHPEKSHNNGLQIFKNFATL